MKQETDPKQVEEVQKLFLRHAGVLKGFVIGLLPDFDLADDVFQEIFLTVTHKADEFSLGSNFLAWVRAIARFKVLEHIRRRHSSPMLLEPRAFDALVATAAELDDGWAERRQALQLCLEKIAPRAREIFALRYADNGMPPAQIARQISWSVGAVHVALARARKFLQECTRRSLASVEV